MTKNTSKTIKMTQNTPKSLKDKNTLKDLQISKEYWSFQRFEYIFSYFGQFRGFMSIFGQLRFQGYFVHFLDFGGILVGFKFFCSFQRILGHFGNLSDVEVYFLIILDVWSILVNYEVTRFDCLFQPFLGCFGHS